jgi:hypothetical protein
MILNLTFRKLSIKFLVTKVELRQIMKKPNEINLFLFLGIPNYGQAKLHSKL